MNLSKYEGKIVRVHDIGGYIFTGTASVSPAEYGLHEFNREEESLEINCYQIFESDIKEIRELPDFSVERITEPHPLKELIHTWLSDQERQLFENAFHKDNSDAKLIAITDRGSPIACALMEPMDAKTLRIVFAAVKKEYRNQGIAAMTVSEAEAWAEELCFSKTAVITPKKYVKFWDKMLYEPAEEIKEGSSLRIRMEKVL